MEEIKNRTRRDRLEDLGVEAIIKLKCDIKKCDVRL
jgi:hypothetical protein